MISEVAVCLHEAAWPTGPTCSAKGREQNNQRLEAASEWGGDGRNGLDMKKEKGFSLLELLIVVAIILLIATIAIPSLLRSRQAANESHAVANLRTLNTAEVQYISTYQQYGPVANLVIAGLLDARYTTGSAGYNFAVTLGSSGLDYTASAIAQSANAGRFDYFTMPDYVIRYSTDSSRAPTGLTGEPVR